MSILQRKKFGRIDSSSSALIGFHSFTYYQILKKKQNCSQNWIYTSDTLPEPWQELRFYPLSPLNKTGIEMKTKEKNLHDSIKYFEYNVRDQ
jgi:hypothetical protein